MHTIPASTASETSRTITSSTALGGADPALGQDPGVGRGTDHGREPGEIAHPLAQLELAHGRQVQRIHGARITIDRSFAADPAELGRVDVVGPGGDDPAHEPMQRRPDVAGRRRDPVAHDRLAGVVDHARR